MLHEKKKLLKITQEMSTFLLGVGATQIHQHLQIKDNLAKICITSDYNAACACKFNAMKRLLKSPRDEAIENQYWELAGSGEVGEASQLLLVGVMTDEVEINILPHSVEIFLSRKLSDFT